jgi:siroheme synthase
VVAQGTTAAQQVVCATLATLADAVAGAGLSSPALTIVGEVVRLRDELAWFDGQAQSAPALLRMSTLQG